ncbi:MAG: hypothetical protein J6P87_05690 [Lachnospiraceae bacterium]|nr:hypothetical protein [Lachnospiraceae bacterium]
MSNDRIRLHGISLGRIIIYIIGVIVLAFGISCNTKTGLGVAPIIAVAYNISVITGMPIGTVTFLYYCFMVVIEIILLKGKLPPVQYLQVLSSFLTSAFLQIHDGLIPSPSALPARIFLMCIGVFFTGLGASLMVSMRLIPNPADGLADVLGKILKKDFGFGKNVLDAICITTALLLGLIFKGKILGIGLGTVFAVIFTGRVIAFVQKYTNRIYEKVK